MQLEYILLLMLIGCASYNIPAQADAALMSAAIEGSRLQTAQKEAVAAKEETDQLRGSFLQEQINDRLEIIEQAGDSQDPTVLKIVDAANQDLTQYRKEQKERADAAQKTQQAQINQYENKMANKAAFNDAVDEGFGDLGWLVLMVVVIFIITIGGGFLVNKYFDDSN